MIGDLILWTKKTLKQTFCIHHYVTKAHHSCGVFQQCKKCGRCRK